MVKSQEEEHSSLLSGLPNFHFCTYFMYIVPRVS